MVAAHADAFRIRTILLIHEAGSTGCGVTMVRRAWMKREQWLIWIAAAIVLTLVLVAIGYFAGGKI
jgi:hypothetical protein